MCLGVSCQVPMAGLRCLLPSVLLLIIGSPKKEAAHRAGRAARVPAGRVAVRSPLRHPVAIPRGRTPWLARKVTVWCEGTAPGWLSSLRPAQPGPWADGIADISSAAPGQPWQSPPASDPRLLCTLSSVLLSCHRSSPG